MINLVQFYRDNHSGYYDKFKEQIAAQDEYSFYDAAELIDEFRNICHPPEAMYGENDIKFILICFWLYKHGYKIKEFPNLLARPTALYDFAYGDVRKFIMKRDGFSGSVRWQDRRELCDRLTITTDTIFQDLPNEIEQKIKLISARGADFDSMEVDERLALLNDLIENLLKVDNKFRKIPYEDVFMKLLSEKEVIDYRKRTHCFRHGSEEAVRERNMFSKEEKSFLIDFGVFAVIHIHRYLKRAEQAGI